jgi:hypothetical protein
VYVHVSSMFLLRPCDALIPHLRSPNNSLQENFRFIQNKKRTRREMSICLKLNSGYQKMNNEKGIRMQVRQRNGGDNERAGLKIRTQAILCSTLLRYTN